MFDADEPLILLGECRTHERLHVVLDTREIEVWFAARALAHFFEHGAGPRDIRVGALRLFPVRQDLEEEWAVAGPDRCIAGSDASERAIVPTPDVCDSETTFPRRTSSSFSGPALDCCETAAETDKRSPGIG